MPNRQIPAGDTGMLDKKELCNRILQLYPDIGKCGIDLKVDYDNRQDSWVVALKKTSMN